MTVYSSTLYKNNLLTGVEFCSGNHNNREDVAYLFATSPAQRKLLKSTDSGVTWTSVDVDGTPGPVCYTGYSVVAVLFTDGTLKLYDKTTLAEETSIDIQAPSNAKWLIGSGHAFLAPGPGGMVIGMLNDGTETYPITVFNSPVVMAGVASVISSQAWITCFDGRGHGRVIILDDDGVTTPSDTFEAVGCANILGMISARDGSGGNQYSSIAVATPTAVHWFYVDEIDTVGVERAYWDEETGDKQIDIFDTPREVLTGNIVNANWDNGYQQFYYFTIMQNRGLFRWSGSETQAAQDPFPHKNNSTCGIVIGSVFILFFGDIGALVKSAQIAVTLNSGYAVVSL